jgi:5-methylcytosine-specific restriction endonuclease McrA
MTSDYRKKIRRKVFTRDSWRCARCGIETVLTLDHIIPKSKGGSDKLNNLQALCFECNQKKADN